MPVTTNAWKCPQCGDVYADYRAASECEKFHGTVAERHMLHYRVCNCLGDSAECCVRGCPCHEPN